MISSTGFSLKSRDWVESGSRDLSGRWHNFPLTSALAYSISRVVSNHIIVRAQLCCHLRATATRRVQGLQSVTS